MGTSVKESHKISTSSHEIRHHYRPCYCLCARYGHSQLRIWLPSTVKRRGQLYLATVCSVASVAVQLWLTRFNKYSYLWKLFRTNWWQVSAKSRTLYPDFSEHSTDLCKWIAIPDTSSFDHYFICTAVVAIFHGHKIKTCSLK